MKPIFSVLAFLAAGGQSVQQNPAEMTLRDESVTFRTAVNVVNVPVVVRDSKGLPVGGLRKEDFQLYDRGKLQSISRFAVEGTAGKESIAAVNGSKTVAVVDPGVSAAVLPDRFVAYLFDDVHAGINDLIMARDAADRHMKASYDAKTRAGIYTTSGQTMLDFTADREKWHETLFKLSPHPIAESLAQRDCPDLTYFWADRIRNQNDSEALFWATEEAKACKSGGGGGLRGATGPVSGTSEVRAAVARVIARTEHSSHVALDVLRSAVQRISVMPGQRTIVLVSPGFLTLIGSKNEESTIIDRAIHANVIVNALDVRGLAVEMPDKSKPTVGLGGPYIAFRERMDHEVFNAKFDVMAELAAGTGGTFYHNSNDLDAGFRRVAAVPDYLYILGFSPQNLKLDGATHALKVSLANNPRHLEVEARHNYTAPKRLDDPVEAAKQEITEAIFSRDELGEIPIELHTEYFRSNGKAQLTVMTHVDLKPLHLRKAEGRHNDSLTIATGIFDANGNYVAGIQRGVDLRLKDDTLDQWLRKGIQVPSKLEVKSGNYLVRVVVRDSEGQLMAARNGSVDIP